MDGLAARMSALSVRVDDIVVLVGLEGAREHNFQAARVLEPANAATGRIGVVRLTGGKKRLSVRRRNLLQKPLRKLPTRPTIAACPPPPQSG